MLEHLQIRGLATIDAVEIEFGAGFSALSGETGAGKSILLDALGLALGGRADALLVREGMSRAEIAASFSLSQASSARDWLQAQALSDPEDPGSCVLRRVLHSEGRSRAFINGTSVPVSQLRDLGEQLVDILGQNESQSLRLAAVQREVLDAYLADDKLLTSVSDAAAAWQQTEKRIRQLREASARDPAQIDWLRHQVTELQALKLGEDELSRIDEEHRRLANGGKLLELGGQAQDALYGADGAIHDQLSACAHRLAALAEIDPSFAESEALVRSAQAQVHEAASGLRRLLDRVDPDPGRLEELESRLAEIHDLARKHRIRPAELNQHLQALETELEQSASSGQALEALLKQQAQEAEAYRKQADKLGIARRAAAPKFCKSVCAHLSDLGMPNARLAVRIESATREVPSAAGMDEVSFEFSANPGQAPRSMSKVASGGELSRIGLAIQVVAQSAAGAHTLIFDEVDAGIGGAVAESVGRLLRELAHRRQVLCVTHLGQVAARAHHHLKVSKSVDEGQTFSAVHTLDEKARIQEVARMISGETITKAGQRMARELLDSPG